MIHDYFRLARQKAGRTTIDDLKLVKYRNDKGLAAFLTSWTTIMAQIPNDVMQNQYTKEVRDELFSDELTKCKEMEYDIRFYEMFLGSGNEMGT